jgi:hypothetical protein
MFRLAVAATDHRPTRTVRIGSFAQSLNSVLGGSIADGAQRGVRSAFGFAPDLAFRRVAVNIWAIWVELVRRFETPQKNSITAKLAPFSTRFVEPEVSR